MELSLLLILIILVLVANSRFNAVKEAVTGQLTVIKQLRADILAFQKELALLHGYVGSRLTALGIPKLVKRFRQAALMRASPC